MCAAFGDLDSSQYAGHEQLHAPVRGDTGQHDDQRAIDSSRRRLEPDARGERSAR